MKIFYNDKGEVVGSVEGATPDIELKVTMPDTGERQVPFELAERLRNPNDPLTHRHLEVKASPLGDEIIIASEPKQTNT